MPQQGITDSFPAPVPATVPAPKAGKRRKTREALASQHRLQARRARENTMTVRMKNQLVRAVYKLTTSEFRVILLAIAKVKVGEVNTEKLYSVSASDLQLLGSDPKGSYRELKTVVDTLFDNEVIYPLGLDVKQKPVYLRTRWIQSVRYVSGEGRIELRFANDILPLITSLQEKFTCIDVSELYGFNSFYSQRLYILLSQYRRLPVPMMTISLTDFRAYMGVDEEKFPVFSDFKRRVVEPAVREINDSYNTKFTVTVQYQRWRRRVCGLHFILNRKDAGVERTDDSVALRPTDEPPLQFTDNMRGLLADWLAGRNVKVCARFDYKPHQLMSFLISHQAVDPASFLYDRHHLQFRTLLFEKLAQPAFVRLIRPFIERLQFADYRSVAADENKS